MLSSAEQPLEAVIRTIIALERACLDSEAALVERRWEDAAGAFASQQRLTDELARLFADAPETAPPHQPNVQKRLVGVLRYRDEQLRRLQAYRDEVGRRLRAFERAGQIRRTIGAAPQPARILNTRT